MSPLAWQGKCPGWLDREPSGVPSGLGSPARPAPACLTFSWKTHPVSWVPGAARRPWETFFAVTLGIRKGDSHAHEMGMGIPAGERYRVRPQQSIPTVLLPSLPSGRGARQVPGAQGPQAGPAREHRSAPRTHNWHSPTPLCHPCWLRCRTYRGARLPSRCYAIHKSGGTLQRHGSAPV